MYLCAADHPDDLQWLDAATLDKAIEIKVNFYAAHLKGWLRQDGLGKSIRDKLAEAAYDRLPEVSEDYFEAAGKK